MAKLKDIKAGDVTNGLLTKGGPYAKSYVDEAALLADDGSEWDVSHENDAVVLVGTPGFYKEYILIDSTTPTFALLFDQQAGDSLVVYVSGADGDDINGDGTKVNPFATIQKGIDHAVGQVGHDGDKIIRVSPGDGSFGQRAYGENVKIDTRNIEIIGRWGDDNSVGQAEIYAWSGVGSAEDEPPVMASNMSQAEMSQYCTDGGGDYSATTSYSYTGASLLSRETWDDANPGGDVNSQPLNPAAPAVAYAANIKLTDIALATVFGNVFGTHNTCFAAVFVPEDNGTLDIDVVGVTMNDVTFLGPRPEIFLKNVTKFELRGFTGPNTVHDAAMVFDNSVRTRFGTEARMGDAIFSFDGADVNGAPFSTNFWDQEGRTAEIMSVDGDFRMYGHSEASRQEMSSVRELHAHGDILVYNGFKMSGATGGSVYMRNVNTKSDYLSDGTELLVERLECENFTRQGSPTDPVVVGHAVIHGNANMNAGSGASKITINGGVIEGNLTVAAGVEIEFVGVTVKGDVTLDATSVVSWNGGTYLGTLTDPGALMGGAAAGSFLNV